MDQSSLPHPSSESRATLPFTTSPLDPASEPDGIEAAALQALWQQALHDRETGDWVAAEAALRVLLTHIPDLPAALYELGTIELTTGRASDAVQTLEQATRVAPEVDQIWNNLGLAYRTLEQWGPATEALERALTLNPTSAAAYHNVADIALALGRTDTACDLLRRSIQCDPNAQVSHVRLGEIQYERKQWSPAADSFAAAWKLGKEGLNQPVLLAWMSQWGVALLRAEQPAAAAEVFRAMLDIDQGLAPIHNNLSYALERLGDARSAQSAAEMALRLAPEFAEAYNNLGVALRAQHRLAEAEAALDHALSLQPEFALARFNLASVCLAQGDFSRGWPAYEARRQLFGAQRMQTEVPEWDGARYPGQTLCVYIEQGFGDTFLFARFIDEARDRFGGSVHVECTRDVVDLLRDCAGVDEAYVPGNLHVRPDFEVPLPSLPGILGVTADRIPTQAAYLQAPAIRRQAWRDRIEMHAPRGAKLSGQSAGSPCRVGLVWQGNAEQGQDVVRSCPLERLTPLFDIADVCWFSLQKGAVGEGQWSSFARRDQLLPLGPFFRDFGETAAAISELDLIISVDTSVAHLAGAMGQTVWVLLCHSPDWRWGMAGDTSPWYPSLRCFRQTQWGDWEGVAQAVARELSAWTRRAFAPKAA